jgi:hypothetical protein
MNLMLPNYDAWALRGPDEQHEVGTEAGDDCNRYAEPNGDEPRGYRARPCEGTMMFENDDETAICNTCGEIAE